MLPTDSVRKIPNKNEPTTAPRIVTESIVQYEIVTQTDSQTRLAGKSLGRLIEQPVVIGLYGDLGSGKTTWVKGLAQGLEVPRQYAVTSPSFTLVNEYPGRLRLYHVDLYRLEGHLDFETIGLDEIMGAPGVVAVEWAQKAIGELPEDHLAIELVHQPDESRLIQLKAGGLGSQFLLKKLSRLRRPV